MRFPGLKSLIFAVPVVLAAQTPDLQVNVVYMCTPPVPNFKVFSCDSRAAGAICDFQNYKNGQANQRGQAQRGQLVAALSKCHLQTAAEAQSSPQRGEVPPQALPKAPARPQTPPATAAPTQPAMAPAGAGGFKVGDHVRADLGGWTEAVIVQVRGNSYFVHTDGGFDFWRDYPSGVRRMGKLTAQDHALGQYDLKDKVQVLVDGKWLEGEIAGYNPTEIHVRLADDRDIYAKVQFIRPSTAPPPAVRAAGQAPAAELKSCAGKYEGRWESSSGMGGMRIVFRSGKATLTEGLSGPVEFECFMNSEKVLLYKAGEFKATETIEINLDGTLQTELGEIKKRGN